jgi:hypothetical protein
MQLTDNRLIGNEGTCKTDESNMPLLQIIVPDPIIFCDDPSASLTFCSFDSRLYPTNDFLEPAICLDAPESINQGTSIVKELLPPKFVEEVEVEADVVTIVCLSPRHKPLN